MNPIQSLIQSGTRLWVDSIDPELVRTFAAMGASGATSNPVIVSDLIATGRFDDLLIRLAEDSMETSNIAWQMTDELVSDAETVFRPVFDQTKGNDGYVSFELDPLIEDDSAGMTLDEQVDRYVELGQYWSKSHPNRMIKVPATPAGIRAVGPLAAAGVPLNVTLIFTLDQYRAARDSIFEGVVKSGRQSTAKSVYSIFVSRIDIYTEKHCSDLSPAAQGMVGIINARTIWRDNLDFWADKGFALGQDIVFASTGTKKSTDAPWKYVAALAGSDIQTNPPATNQAVAESDQVFSKTVDQVPAPSLADEISNKVDLVKMHEILMKEGLEKFCAPQKALLNLIQRRQDELSASAGT